MKKSLALICSLALCLGLFAGCSSSNAGGSASPSASVPASPSQEASQAPAALSGVVNTDGSTSMEKVVKVLSESFMQDNGGVTINYNGSGSGTGIQSAIDGTCDLGLSSRELKDEESANGAVAHVVALDGVAIVVNPANTVADLTVEQIAKIYTGEIADWSELGGAAGPIAVIGREAGSGTRGAFEELTETVDGCKYTQELTSTGAVITAVSTTPNAIGYASLSSVEDSVKALKVGGVECTEETVLDGTYAIQRPFVFATKTGSTLSEAAQAFYDFAMDPANAGLYTTAGVVPANS